MKLGVILEGETIESLAAQALAAETAGIDIAWLPVDGRMGTRRCSEPRRWRLARR